MRLSRSVLLRVTPPWPQGRGRPWFLGRRGLSQLGLLRASATLDQQMLSARRNLADRLSGRDRAARCPTRKTCPASDASRPPVGPAVNKGCRLARPFRPPRSQLHTKTRMAGAVAQGAEARPHRVCSKHEEPGRSGLLSRRIFNVCLRGRYVLCGLEDAEGNRPRVY